MNRYPALESELEKALRDDRDGTWTKELQRSLRDFAAAVDVHTRDGLTLEHYKQWRGLQKAAEAAVEAMEEVRLRIHER